MPCGGLSLQPLHRAIERPLQEKPDSDHDRQHQERDPGQWSGDQEQHANEDHREDEIGGRDDRAGGEEVADGIEVADLVGEDAHGARPVRHLDREHMLVDIRRQHHVDLLAGQVDDPAAYDADDEVEQDREPKSDAECDEGWNRTIGDDAIIDVHREQRRGERQQVHQKSRKRDVAVVRPEAPDHAPEPVMIRQATGGDGTGIGRRFRPHQEGITGIARLELRE